MGTLTYVHPFGSIHTFFQISLRTNQFPWGSIPLSHGAAGPPTNGCYRTGSRTRSRWSLDFVKNLTILEVGSTGNANRLPESNRKRAIAGYPPDRWFDCRV